MTTFGDQVRYFSDNGTEFNPNLMRLPDLCATCTHNNDSSQEILCNLTRADQQGEKVFVCFAFQPSSPAVDRESVLRGLCSQAGIPYMEDEGSTDDDEQVVRF